METQPIEELVILPRLTLPMVTLQFPPLYIIAPAMVPPKYRHKSRHQEAIDHAPLDTVALDDEDKDVVPFASEPRLQRLAEEQLYAEATHIITTLLRVDRSHWSVTEKWRIINVLAEAGCTLPLFSREKAAVALLAMREDLDE
jgi:hypothetical protein